MQQDNQPIVVNLPEGQNTLTLLQGYAPKTLDQKEPLKINIEGTLEAPYYFLQKRIGDIDQHKAHVLVNRDELSIELVYNEDSYYTKGIVKGSLELSNIFKKFGINTDKQWIPEQLGKFLKLNRSFFVNIEENMNVVNALKSFNAKVEQTVEKESKENGNKAFSFRQAVDSNIPPKFRLSLPIFKGGSCVEIEVETYAEVDGSHVTVSLQSPGAVDAVEDIRRNLISAVVEEIKKIAPEIAIIEE